jgi:hypothetical protein
MPLQPWADARAQQGTDSVPIVAASVAVLANKEVVAGRELETAGTAVVGTLAEEVKSASEVLDVVGSALAEVLAKVVDGKYLVAGVVDTIAVMEESAALVVVPLVGFGSKMMLRDRMPALVEVEMA